MNREMMRLYAVTDRKWLDGRSLSAVVEQAIQGGVTCVQLREKDLSLQEFEQEAIKVRQVTERYRIPFIINDEVELAARVNADGVHIGQEDMNIKKAREILGTGKIVGVSAHNVEEALLAEQEGADYLGVGACFSTDTKKNTVNLSKETLQQITEAVHIPVVAIGGIGLENVMQLKGTGIDGIAVVSAIFSSSDIQNAAKKLREITEEEILGMEE